MRLPRARLCLLLAITLWGVAAGPGFGETLRVGRTALPASLGNPFTAAGRPSSGLWIALFDALTQIDASGALQPALALSWENTAPTTWVFRLRPDVRFHNGEPFTAAAVVATMALLRSEAGAGLYVAAEMKDVASVRAKDELTVEFHTRAPDPILPKRLSIVYIVEPKSLARAGLEGLAAQPVGTGPFKLLDWGHTVRRSSFRAFPDSWRKPGVERLEMIWLPDASARLQALLAGHLDIMEGFSPDDAEALAGRPYRHYSQPAPQVMSLAFRNVRDEDAPLKDPRVRQALNYAVDRQEIAQAIGRDYVAAASQGAVAGVVGYNPALAPYPYDPKRARALLAAAGYPNGLSLRIEVLAGFIVSDSLVYQAAADDLAAVGVDVQLQVVPYATWLSRFMGNSWGNTDAFSWAWTALFYDAARALQPFTCVRDNPFFCDAESTAAYQDATREMDPAQREEKLMELMTVVQGLAPALWLVTVTHDYAVHRRVKGFAAGPMGILYDRVRFHP
jgi:peptide/nickel transport system substrate-binding protein